MSAEILMLGILVGITLLAYMMAINSHGPIRLYISYLIATVILAGTVWSIVQYVNTDLDRKKLAELHRLEQEKLVAEERLRSQTTALQENQERAMLAGQLMAIINKGTGLASSLISANMRDMALDLQGLIARSTSIRKQCEELRTEFTRLTGVEASQEHFTESIAQLRTALDDLVEASRFYLLYYRSEDSAQE